MSSGHKLKKISEKAVEAALEKAETYRLLNDPEQAESICLDVLAIDADDEAAKRIMILALTDQFAQSGVGSKAQLARKLASELSSEYQRHYYLGLVSEREGRSFLAKGLSGAFAYESLVEAMRHFEAAEPLRPEGNDETILRYNSCVRTIESRGLEPRHDEGELPLE